MRLRGAPTASFVEMVPLAHGERRLIARDSIPFHGVHDPRPWRARAAEMRALAGEVTDDKIAEIILKLAIDYDQLALRAEEFVIKDQLIKEREKRA